MKKFIGIIALAVSVFGAVSCEDFLNRPSEDSYVVDGFYKNEQMEHQLEVAERQVLNNEISSFIAAHNLLTAYGRNNQK